VTRALVVEDDRSWQTLLSEILSDSGLQVDVAAAFDEAVAALKSQPHRVAVVDLSLVAADHNNQDGLRVLEAIRLLDPACRAILLTGFATVELAVSALSDHNAFHFMRKENFQRAQFRDVVQRALQTAPLADVEPIAAPPVRASVAAADAAAGHALVVDDDAGWRNILTELLTDAGFSVRSCASFGDALGYLHRDSFTLATVDLSLSGSSFNLRDHHPDVEALEGYQLLKTTREHKIPTIVISGAASPEEIERAYAEQSIFAYLEKQSFDRAAFKRAVSEARASGIAKSDLDVLTDREREVLNLLATGLTNKEIAEKLVITTNTVKRHLKAVFEKLDVHTRAAAVAKVAKK
jgi:DNA-binding NarL/FixJ family response regulator